MIEWLKKRFPTVVCVLFVLYVIWLTIGTTIIGVVVGTGLAAANKAESLAYICGFLGFVLGIIMALLSGVLIYGFFATVHNISKTNEEILNILKEKNGKTPDQTVRNIPPVNPVEKKEEVKKPGLNKVDMAFS